MTRTHAILSGPFFLALIGTAFCIWSALGNDVNFCVTTGCALYEDFSIGGVSLWWFGTGAFTLLCAAALLGQAGWGRLLAGLFLFGDVCLLLLMAFTAPCVSCLAAAALFALCYLVFRRADAPNARGGAPERRPHSLLLWVWLALFVVNIGQVARSQFDIWPIMDESGDAKVRMFFSPSCRYCVEGINVLSGNVETAFYPIAENEADIYRLAKMTECLDKGMNLAEALGQSQEAVPGGFWQSLSPEMMLLRFRLLRNKAHVFAAGSRGVPFFERKGLPPDVGEKAENRSRGSFSRLEPAASSSAYVPADPTLPIDTGGQCGAGLPCPPPANSFQ